MKYIVILAASLTLLFSSCGKYEKEEEQHKGVDTTNTADEASSAESNGTKK